MRLDYTPFDLHTKTPFEIARWQHSVYPRAVITLRTDDSSGIGEAAPNAYYGETRDTVAVALKAFEAHLPDDPFAWQTLHEGLQRAFPQGHYSAKAAVEAACLDLCAKRAGLPLYKLFGLPEPQVSTSLTIGISDLDTMKRGAAEAVADGYPILKVKLGTEQDEAIIAAIREAAPEVTLRVDANAAWTFKEAQRKLEMLETYRVEFVEQPLPPGDLEGFNRLSQGSRLPLAADESFVTMRDLKRLHCDIINVKLSKIGGPWQAMQAMQAAKGLGFEVMLGCMVESSLGITAAAHVAGLADYLDLDGALLLADDPFVGITFDDMKKPLLPSEPGLGVREARER